MFELNGTQVDADRLRTSRVQNSAESSSLRTHGRLRLRFEAGDATNETILSECEQHPPLRVVRAFQLDDGRALVHLHNLSGGVLGGDRLAVTIDVGPCAVAQVTSTGATRIYRSRKNAEQGDSTLQIRVEDDGLVEYLVCVKTPIPPGFSRWYLSFNLVVLRV